MLGSKLFDPFPFDMDPDSKLEGQVYTKEKGGFFSKFRKSYIVLRASTLGIHKNKDNMNAITVLLLQDIINVDRRSNRPFCLELQFSSNRKPIMIAFDAEEEMLTWLDSFKKVSVNFLFFNILSTFFLITSYAIFIRLFYNTNIN